MQRFIEEKEKNAFLLSMTIPKLLKMAVEQKMSPSLFQKSHRQVHRRWRTKTSDRTHMGDRWSLGEVAKKNICHEKPYIVVAGMFLHEMRVVGKVVEFC